MLEDEPIPTGLECPQCGRYCEPPRDGAHREILCPYCRAILLFETSDDGQPRLAQRHTLAVPEDFLREQKQAAQDADDAATSTAATPEETDDDDGHEFRVSAPEPPKPQGWFLPPPLPPADQQPDEMDADVEPPAPVVVEPVAKVFLSPDVFLYAWRFAAIKQWILLAVALSFTLWLALRVATAFSNEPGADWGMGVFYLFPGMAMLVFTLALGGAYLAAITERTAYHTDTSGDWPGGDWRQRFGEGLRVALLLVQAAMLGGMMGGLASLAAPLAFWPVCAIGIFFFFPIIFLSGLESDTAMAPVSLPVLRSLRVCSGAWGVFYVTAAVIWLAVAGLAVGLPRLELVWPLVVGPLGAAGVFGYGRLLGRLTDHLARHGGFLAPETEID